MNKITVTLVGNPNTGKSTLFSALCGVRTRIGNYPGVTVEKKIGGYEESAGRVEVVDLPGTYSLAATTLDEKVSVDVLLGRHDDVPNVDVIAVVTDATNLERNLYLFSQIRELGRPVLLILNMWDRVAAEGVKIDVPALSQSLGHRIITVSASQGKGIDEVKRAIRDLAGDPPPAPSESVFPECVQEQIDSLAKDLRESTQESLPRFVLQRTLLDKGGAYEQELVSKFPDKGIAERIQQARQQITDAGVRLASVEATSRYKNIRASLSGSVQRDTAHRVTTSDRIDRFLTHKVWGLLSFAAVMFLVFQAITLLSGYAMDLIAQWAQPAATEFVSSVLPPGILRSLINDGLVAGVGSVVIFLPQILMLFFFIGLLEDCGYMARAAFVMDKLMTKLGLSGKSFLPLMSSFACAVPGIMATRVIENWRDRMVTILVAPLMSCSARLPVYVLLTSAFIPNTGLLGGWVGLQGVVLFAMHLVGVVVAVPVAWLLKKFFFPGEVPPFVMELPSYKIPTPAVVFYRVWERAQAFLLRAGTLIFCTSILVWAAGYFPGDHTQLHELEAKLEAADIDESTQANLEQDLRIESGRLIESSFLGIAGHAIEPVVKPLGWDWRIGVGVIASFPAREVILATLGTIYSLGGEAEDEPLQAAMLQATWDDGSPVFTVPVALSIMVFFALCAQCAATLMVIKRETNSWRWPIFTFVYMTALAYIAALLTYQIGNLF